MATTFVRKVTRFFKKMGVVGYSKKRNIFGIHPLFVSTIYIFLTLLLTGFLRKIVKSLLSETIFKQMLLEFISTMELCAACFELIIVAENWGVWTYAFYLFLLTIWWGLSWESASACPYSPIEEIIEGTKDLNNAALIIFAQLLGAIATFRYVQILWAMELVETHRGKAYEKCVADLQVHMAIGAVIEAVATCLCRLTSRVLSETGAKFGNIMDAFFGTMMVVAAFDFSGGYFNPALATSLKLGCKGNTFLEHMVVYWLGATIGSVMSVLIYRTKMFQDYIRNFREKIE